AAAQLGMLERVGAFVTPDGALRPGARAGAPKPAQAIKDDALLAACRAKQTAVAAYLLDAGARIDAHDADERLTALHESARRCDQATTRMLIDRGAPLEAKNAYGGTVLGFAVWVIRRYPGKGRDWRGLVDLLLAAGADPEAAGGRDAIEAALRQ